MTRPGARLRLVPAAGVAWAVAAAATVAPHTAAVLAGCCWSAAVMTILVIAVGRPRSRVWVVLVLAFAAAAAAASHVLIAQPARTAVDTLTLSGGRAVVVTATAVGKVERRASGELAFDVVATRISAGAVDRAVRFDAAVRVRPADVDRLSMLEVGAQLRAEGTTYPADAGARAVLIVAARNVTVTEPASGPVAFASGLRRGLVAAAVGLPQPGAGLLPGLAVGDTSMVPPALDTAMKRSSLSHLTAVSGANCALVVGLAFGAVALLGGSRRLRVLGGIVALAGFVVLVTPEPSVVRAAAMAGTAMIAVLLGRPAVGIAVLSLATALAMVIDPWLSTSLGFALSAVATAALLVGARPLAAGLARWMPRSLALALAVPLAAQLACGPLLILITPSVPVYGVIANLLAAPAAPLATIVGLAACLALPLPLFQSGLTALAWAPAAWIAATAQVFSALPGGQLPWPGGWQGAVLLAVCGAAVAVLIVLRNRRRWARLARAMAALLVTVLGGIVAGSTVLAAAPAAFTLPAHWSILACDVGQGDALLVRSAGHVALIDTGPEPARLSACLTRTGVSHLDLLVLTHYDADHRGGVGAVIGHVDTVIHGPPVTSVDRGVLAALQGGGATLVDGKAGLHGVLGRASWRVVWPVGESRGFPGGNVACVVVEFSGGAVPASVFLGDLSAAPQSAMVASGVLSHHVDVVKVAHHGSADQDPELYRLMSPTVALISVGAGNTFGHPRPGTLRFLADGGAEIARTDQSGIVALWSTPGGVAVWREHGSDVVGPG